MDGMAHDGPRGDKLASWVVAIAVAGAALVVGMKRTTQPDRSDPPAAPIAAKRLAAPQPAQQEPQARAGAASPEPPAGQLSCESYAGTANETMCLLAWGRCTDGARREVRCVYVDDHFECDCVVDAATISSFKSPNFCILGGSIPSISQATLTEAASSACGWSIGQ
jgi:hypothetical protein